MFELEEVTEVGELTIKICKKRSCIHYLIAC